MTNSHSKMDDGFGRIPKKNQPPLPLVPKDRVSEESCSYKLRSVPTDADSSKYSFTMSVLEGSEETPARAALTFYKDMHRVFDGLGMGANPGADIESRANLTTRMLRGNALAAFTKAYADAKALGLETAQQAAEDAEAPQDVTNGETNAAYAARIATARNNATYDAQRADINMGFHAIMLEMCPAKSLQRQKRWMRRHVRKTRDITVRNFASHLARINDEEIPLLPPRFDNTQKLADDEMLDILINACPKKWQSEMDRLDFDASASGWAATVDFLARQERAGEHDEDPSTQVVQICAKKPKTQSSSDKGKGSGGGKSSGMKFCHYHGSNPTHDSNNCRTLKKMAESAKDGGGSKNKSWSRKSDNAKKDTKKDLAAFISKTVRKELHAFSKKRKNEDLQ